MKPASVTQRRSSRGAANAARGEPADRRQFLLDRLEEIFLREGYRRVTVGDLAARLRCSRRTIYELADSKEELFLTVLDRLLSRIERMGHESAAKEATARGRIRAFMRPGSTQPMAATGAFFGDVSALPAARRRLEEHQQSRVADLRSLIEDGVRAGECRRVHAEVAAHAMLAAYRAITEPAFLMRVDVSLGEAVHEAQDLVLDGLLRPEG